MSDLAQRTAETLATDQVGVVVGAVLGDARGFGAAGRTGGDDDRRPDPHTLFEIGSVTKVFTALSLARRVVAGAVDLDEPVRALLPDGTAVPSRGGREITPRHLATHTSGLPRLPRGALRQALAWRTPPDPYARYTEDVVLRDPGRTRLRATPGDRFRYSNLGAGLLGLALAHRAGTGYETLVTTEVCRPLGLTDTVITLDGPRRARAAQGHDRARRPTPPWHLAALAGAGGLWSTATDLVTFLRAQLTSPDDAAVRLTRDVTHTVNRGARVHLGWMGLPPHPRLGHAELLWHNGGTGGFRSWVGLVPDRHAAVAVLANTTRSPDARAIDLLRALAFGDLRAADR